VLLPTALALFTLWGELRPGPHAIGYRRVVLQDDTRSARSLVLNVWYPARPARDMPPMRYGGYVERDPAFLRDRAAAIAAYAQAKFMLDAGAYERLLQIDTAAFADAAPAPGAFPRLVYAGGAGNPTTENVLLGEYLASHGWVVAALPATGFVTPDISLDAAGLETVARDLEFADAWLRREPFVRKEGAVLGGFSFGAAGALAAANRTPDVRAVVMLDSSAMARRFAHLIVGAPFFEPERLHVPILDLHRQDENVSYDALDRLRYAQRFSIEVTGANHFDFNSFAVAYAALSEAPGEDLRTRSRSWQQFARVIREFLESVERGKAGAEAWRAAPEVYPARLRAQAALPLPPSPADVARTARESPERAVALLDELVRTDAQAAVLRPEAVNSLGYELLRTHVVAAREIFYWNVRRDPANAGWLDSLGDALLATGQTPCAYAVFARVVELTGSAADSASRSLRERALREKAALSTANVGCDLQLR
jgi:dienelactone hydrolase